MIFKLGYCYYQDHFSKLDLQSQIHIYSIQINDKILSKNKC
jgi:hypothetical protein